MGGSLIRGLLFLTKCVDLIFKGTKYTIVVGMVHMCCVTTVVHTFGFLPSAVHQQSRVNRQLKAF